MFKYLLAIFLITPLSTVAHATPTQAEILCLEIETVLNEFIGHLDLTQADVDEIVERCYSRNLSITNPPDWEVYTAVSNN